ncbi:MAG: leucine-rich repeat domain-containing protein, partial [Oscillospiraceae bacterium]|nr:leucine-rich repeat domain-containing protein [Oscillospiraceae bacterium]
LAEKLKELPRLEKLDICGLDFTNDESLALIDQFPDIEFTWRVHFGRWAVRSDIVAFSTLQSPSSYHYTSEELAPLFKYCTKLTCLDVGHNSVSDLEPIGQLKNLKVLIVADNKTITDISPLANLTNLEYLELFMPGQVRDYSALENLVNLEDINICYCHHFTDPMLFRGMTNLKRAWVKGCGATHAAWDELRKVLPDTEILVYSPNLSSTCGTWRSNERNVAIRKVFGNWENVLEYNHWDDVTYREGVELKETYPMTESP